MVLVLALQSSSGPGQGVFELFASVWWCGGVLAVGQFVLFVVALVQILTRSMPTDAKLLWGAVTWFLPILGPILWWTIGSKQNPPGRPLDPY